MKTNRPISQKKVHKSRNGQIVLLAAVLLLSALSSWWVITRTDSTTEHLAKFEAAFQKYLDAYMTLRDFASVKEIYLTGQPA